MGDAEVTANNWKLVEVGRVAIFRKGQYNGKLAAIVQIIDHKRVCLSAFNEELTLLQNRISQELKRLLIV